MPELDISMADKAKLDLILTTDIDWKPSPEPHAVWWFA